MTWLLTTRRRRASIWILLSLAFLAVASMQSKEGLSISEDDAIKIATEWAVDSMGVDKSEISARAIWSGDAWEVIAVIYPAPPDSHFHVRISSKGRVIAVGSGGAPLIPADESGLSYRLKRMWQWICGR